MDEKIGRAFFSAFGVTAEEFSDALSPEQVKGWDSLGHLRLVMALQEEFGVEFEVDEIMRMESVAKIRTIIAERQVAS
jgi:acyl carrier protein